MSRLNHLLITSVSVAMLAIACAGQAGAANTFKVLHAFGSNLEDGDYPFAGLTYYAPQSGFYGVTNNGGDQYCGVIYRVTSSGNFKMVHSFDGNDGCQPYGDLLNPAGATVFYGTAYSNGANGGGTLYKLTDKGTYTVLHAFAGGNDDGILPTGSLAQDNNGNLYGSTVGGGPGGQGIVYQLKKNGAFTMLASFDGGSSGQNPAGGIILGNAHDGRNGSVLFGTTYQGGASYGVVFKVDVDKKKLTVLHTFTGNDGAYPYSTVIEGPEGNLYGTTVAGGHSSMGTVYKIATNGAFSILYNFHGSPDGSSPEGNLLLTKSGMLYGTTVGGGGVCNCGTVFGITADGTKYHILHSFDSSTDGQNPMSDLTELVDKNGKHTLYGTTSAAGASGGGTVFSVAE